MAVVARWADWLPPDATPVDLIPLYPVVALTPSASCPHRGPIRDDSRFVCEQCAAVSRVNQRRIDRRGESLPPPEDPERRIARWHREYARGVMTAEQMEAHRELADELLKLVDPPARRRAPAPDPKSKPELKGGIG